MAFAAIKLPRSVVERLRREAEKLGLTLEEYIVELALQGLDPPEAARGYLEAALNLVEEAREELGRGDLRQASEKIWGACALAIKAHALAVKGLRLESHAELWRYKDEVARELGSWVRIAYKIADSMRKNFYEGLATREDVEDALMEVERLVRAITARLRGR